METVTILAYLEIQQEISHLCNNSSIQAQYTYIILKFASLQLVLQNELLSDEDGTDFYAACSSLQPGKERSCVLVSRR